MRDRADAVIADRSMADDMRAAADLCSRWASCRDGRQNPDLPYLAICELNERLNDYPETGEAVRATDVFLAMHAVDASCSLIASLRQIANAPPDFDVRKFVTTMLLQPIGVDPTEVPR